jgi:photosystem II stability/assembly factor-like uncharacterized protein
MRTCHRVHYPTRPAFLIGFALLILIFKAPGMYGTDSVWISGGGGGVIHSMVVDPQNPSTVYAGTYGGGVFKSIDSGSTWKVTPLWKKQVNVLAIDPQNSSTLYAGTLYEYDSLYKSTNGGDTWSGSSGGIPNTTVYDVAIDPQVPSTLYAATHMGLYKSTNSGDSWTRKELDNANISIFIIALAIDPKSTSNIYAATEHGVYKSSDSGENWKMINKGLSTTMAYDLIIDPQNPSILYAGYYMYGIFKSTDRGGSWSAVNNGLKNTSINALAIDIKNSGILYAGTSGGVFRSTNGGSNWNSASDDLPVSEVCALAINPSNPSTLYSGTEKYGVYKSLDSGNTWSSSNMGLSHLYIKALAIDPTNPSTLYAGAEGSGILSYGGGVYKSTDRGRIWELTLDLPVILSLAIDPQNPAVLYAGTESYGVYKSTNGGAKWVKSSGGMTSKNIRALVIDPLNTSTVYAGAYDGGVYKSIDGGASWGPKNSGLPGSSVSRIVIDPSNPSILYVNVNGVYKSINGGLSWNPAYSGFTDWDTYALAIDPRNPSVLYAGVYGGGIFKSTDGALTWNAINKGLTYTYIDAIVVDPQTPSIVYAASRRDVFKSTDGGGNWTAFSDGLPEGFIWALAIDPLNPSTVYAGTDGLGVFVTFRPEHWSKMTSSLPDGGAASISTVGLTANSVAGYAVGATTSGNTPYGTAVFSFKQNGVTVSEAGVPASPPTTSALVFIDYRSRVSGVPGRSNSGTVDINTGIGIVNYGTSTAHITCTLLNTNGNAIATGQGTLAAGNHVAKFINQLKEVASGFALPSDFQFGSLDIASDQPLSVIALRMTTNQRGEAFFTTTSVVDRNQPLTNTPIYFPQLADGGGWTTALILLNTSSSTENGIIDIFDNDGLPFAVRTVGRSAILSSFRYSIPPGGTFRIQTDGSSAGQKAGWGRLTPDNENSTPLGSGVFSFNPADILTTESGIPSVLATTHARVFVDLTENHNTGLAIANLDAADTNIAIQAFQTDGVTPAGQNQGPLPLVGYGHDAKFANQFISGLPDNFTGVLDISSPTPFAALTIRSLNNERKDFLLTTFPVADSTRSAPSPIVFPHIADGGGYMTQFIMLSVGGPANTTLSLYGEDGKPLAVGK